MVDGWAMHWEAVMVGQWVAAVVEKKVPSTASCWDGRPE